MQICVPKEILPEENRVAVIPETVAKYIKLGFDVAVETGAGKGAYYPDEAYERAGAKIVADARELYAMANLILKVKQPEVHPTLKLHEVDMMPEGCTLITFLHPAAPQCHAMVRMLRDRKVTSFTMDGIPRISRAQQMDALTSMSTVTGYKSVLLAANLMPRFIPMIGTAIGAVNPAKFLIVGTGVVGLQAIATAKRLGGIVRAIDIRAQAQKEAGSLGAKLVDFQVPPDLAIGEGGYAKALSMEWLEKERGRLQPEVAEADCIILCALVPGEVAPILVTESMLEKMKPGSVIIDVSVDQGGNCESTVKGAVIEKKGGIKIFGIQNIPGQMAVHASWLYANNMLHFVENLYKKGLPGPDFDDEIVHHSLVTYQGKILFAGALKAMGEA